MLALLKAPPRIGRFAQSALLVVLLTCLGLAYFHDTAIQVIQQQNPLQKGPALTQPSHHPIDDLRTKADQVFNNLLAREARDIRAAEQAYHDRRGRRPPPGFDAWFSYAQARNAVIVEDFFDRIYDDLAPFWAIPPLELRQQARDWIFRVVVRNGTMSKAGDEVDRPWLDLWGDLVGTIAEYLPDMDIAINEMDESRIIAPWETVNEHMLLAQRTRRIVPQSDLVTSFNNTAVREGEEFPPFDFAWLHNGPYWEHAVLGCPPDSPARKGFVADYDFTKPPTLPTSYPAHSYQGYVQNWTLTKSPCDNPDLQGLHGTFVEPLSISNTRKLFPMFGGSKLPMNNEILLPPAMYWTKDEFYSGGSDHGSPWEDKRDKIIWRGAASGGRNKAENWTRFQRHRFLAMINGTTVRGAEKSGISPPNFELPGYGAYHLQAMKTGFLGDWLDNIADAAFVHLLCFPDTEPPFCPYTNPWYSVAESMPMKLQYAYKYLPDLDGNSFSGRYRGFLLSTSLPIKATIYDEWHDSRLVPWKHFVPMDNTYVDIYGILEYFLGAGNIAGRDEAAKSIALGGKEWAEKVLRREDMQIYVYRLLLEYARLCDDDREVLGWMS